LEAGNPPAAFLDRALGAYQEPSARAVDPPDVRAVDLDLARRSEIQSSERAIERLGLVGDPVAAERQAQSTALPFGTAPGACPL
jgi:hypothetical protein